MPLVFEVEVTEDDGRYEHAGDRDEKNAAHESSCLVSA